MPRLSAVALQDSHSWLLVPGPNSLGFWDSDFEVVSEPQETSPTDVASLSDGMRGIRDVGRASRALIAGGFAG